MRGLRRIEAPIRSLCEARHVAGSAPRALRGPPMSLSPARRARKRRHLLYYLEVYDRGSGELLGRVGDLTQDGMLLLCDDPVEAGQVLDVEVRLPDIPGLVGDAIAGRCTVRWSGADKNPAIFCAGCQCEPLDPKALAELDALLKAAAFEDADL